MAGSVVPQVGTQSTRTRNEQEPPAGRRVRTMNQRCGHIHFVTGRLAEQPLRAMVARCTETAGCRYSIHVLPISVAALMTTPWVARHVQVPPEAGLVLLPGYCRGDLEPLARQFGVEVARGPRDLRHLPEWFGQDVTPTDYGSYSIEILAEINHAPRLSRDDLLRQARALRADGADVIDLGCEPGNSWTGVTDAVRVLRDEGLRVSIDSFHAEEVRQAVRAGAELVLSVNSSNRAEAVDWGCEVVVIPDDPRAPTDLEASIEFLDTRRVPFRIDPIVEPIGLGFAASLGRYLDVRARYPRAAMLMGIGNLTEMTDADSAAINLLLLGFCQELDIGSVLTTQVISWARTSVRECNLARRLVHHAVTRGVPAKHLSGDLVLLRDDKLEPFGQAQLAEFAERIKDHNFRIFAEDGTLHIMNGELHLSGPDAFALHADVVRKVSRAVTADHAFYLGYEMAKAELALRLGKQYRQDQPLDWGFLSREPADNGAQHGEEQHG